MNNNDKDLQNIIIPEIPEPIKIKETSGTEGLLIVLVLLIVVAVVIFKFV